MKFRTELEEAWAEGFDYFQISWEYRPWKLRLKDGRYYIPDFFLPEQEVCVNVLCDQPDMSYYDIRQAALASRKMMVLAGEFGHFSVLNYSEENSFICRCSQCGRYYFSGGPPKICSLCKSRETPLTDFWLNGNNQHGVHF